MKKKNTYLYSCGIFASLGLTLISNLHGQIVYTWDGDTDALFTTVGNWSTSVAPTSVAPTGGTSNSRISVNNGTNNTLVYGSAQGTTIYSGGGAGARALVIGATSGGGSMIITGGTFDSRQTLGDVVGHAGNTGTLTIDGGSYISTNGAARPFYIGLDGANTNGTLTVNSGSFTTTLVLFGTNNATITGTLNLNGGTTTVTKLAEGTGTNATDAGHSSVNSTINFNGGILRAGAGGTLVTVGINNAVVKAGGAIIDTNGFDTAIDKVLSAGSPSGGLTKQGAGTLTLSAANAYTGATTITTGTLALTGAGAISSSSSIIANGTLSVSGITGGTFTIGSAQMLTGAGSIAATGKTVSVAGIHSPGIGAGVQAVTGNLSYAASSTFNWDLNSNSIGTRGADYDGVTVSGNLNVTAGAQFRVVQNAGANFADAFWNTNRTWTDTFNVSGTTTGWAANTSVSVYNTSNVLQDVSARGAFTVTGTSLTWTAVPEASNLLIAGLLGFGFISRRRKQA